MKLDGDCRDVRVALSRCDISLPPMVALPLQGKTGPRIAGETRVSVDAWSLERSILMCWAEVYIDLALGFVPASWHHCPR